jgi:hypothetical protein
MEDDRLPLLDGDIHLIEVGERHMPRAGDFLAGVLIRLADVDQDGAAVEQALGLAWVDSRK